MLKLAYFCYFLMHFCTQYLLVKIQNALNLSEAKSKCLLFLVYKVMLHRPYIYVVHMDTEVLMLSFNGLLPPTDGILLM